MSNVFVVMLNDEGGSVPIRVFPTRADVLSFLDDEFRKSQRLYKGTNRRVEWFSGGDAMRITADNTHPEITITFREVMYGK